MTSQKWRNKNTDELFAAFLQLNTINEMAAFCRDLMTEPEIKELAGRWQVAQALDNGYSQRQVAANTGISIATVTRVNQWLQRGMGGYKLALARSGAAVMSNHKHLHSAVAAL